MMFGYCQFSLAKISNTTTEAARRLALCVVGTALWDRYVDKVPSGRDDAGVHRVHVVIDPSIGMASYTCDFSQLKVPDQKHFLKIRGIPHSGKGKDDLVQLCIAAQPCYAEIEPCDHEVSEKKRY